MSLLLLLLLLLLVGKHVDHLVAVFLGDQLLALFAKLLSDFDTALDQPFKGFFKGPP